MKRYESKIKNIHLIIFLLKRQEIDFDVFLESSDDNLQRSHVWKKEDKIDFVDDMINNLDFSNFGNIIIDISDVKKKKGIITDKELLCLDGKQRLHAFYDYIDNKFKINGKFYKELDKSEQRKLQGLVIITKYVMYNSIVDDR